MSPPSATCPDPAWSRSLGVLIEALDKPNFWAVLLRLLQDQVALECWVVLLFHRHERPEVLFESAVEGGGEDLKFKEYLSSFYLLDPFYLACLEEPRTALLRLDEVAPDRFEAEDYFQRYFNACAMRDELQFLLAIDGDQTLSLSLGAGRRFSPDEMQGLSSIAPWVLALMKQRWRFERQARSLAQAATTADPSQVDASTTEDAAPPLALGLTLRELEVVHQMLSGNSLKGIAQKLSISPETVKVHRRHIYSKLGVRSHPELFAILIQARALPLPRAKAG